MAPAILRESWAYVDDSVLLMQMILLVQAGTGNAFLPPM